MVTWCTIRLLFIQIYKDVYNVQGAWHSTNMLPKSMESWVWTTYGYFIYDSPPVFLHYNPTLLMDDPLLLYIQLTYPLTDKYIIIVQDAWISQKTLHNVRYGFPYYIPTTWWRSYPIHDNALCTGLWVDGNSHDLLVKILHVCPHVEHTYTFEIQYWLFSSKLNNKKVMWGGGYCVTFNTISAISRWSVFLVEETSVHKEAHRPVAICIA